MATELSDAIQDQQWERAGAFLAAIIKVEGVIQPTPTMIGSALKLAYQQGKIDRLENELAWFRKEEA